MRSIDQNDWGPKVGTGLVGLAITLGLVWFGPGTIPNVVSGFAAPSFTGTVTRVVDGDTFYITGQDVRIRVWGLDAPEVGTYGGSAATSEMFRLVSGKPLTFKKRNIDKYGRIVGQCFLADGRDIT